MPPKREAGATPSPTPPPKMLKLNTVPPEDGPMEELPESTYSPFFHTEQEFEEINDEGSQGIRTDTISLLMKIEELQAQLKYERRCRILAERELREMKEMNTLMAEMRHTAHQLRATLDHVLQGGDATMVPHNSQDEDIAFLPGPEAQTEAVGDKPEDTNNYMYLAEDLRVPRNLYEHVGEISDYKKYTAALLMMLFDRETLATHSLQGRRNTVTGEDCSKPQLPPEILRSIINHVRVKFGVDSSQIRTAIRTKLNNEDKLLKKRMGMVKVEPKPNNVSI
ncbi:uncharacterized protein LOC119122814 isoform X1 [Syngnathus acus]|uniref:uncharacterized protein LOC119122814 isoform X1 n=1 Tax=Syngnathus acus TaxID=161584 RepID=UPI0018862EF0|nr:uncharacterized protein LOC119122814 isoform X1 [Syngnathus acus]XP_037107295.1 uncharacterized protein LOC119122814 isoform X1 [Syngnathus acus]